MPHNPLHPLTGEPDEPTTDLAPPSALQGTVPPPTPVPAPILTRPSFDERRGRQQIAPTSPSFPGVSEAQRTVLEAVVLTYDSTLVSGEGRTQRIVGWLAQDPAVVAMTFRELEHKMGLSTIEFLDDRASKQILRYVTNEQAWTLASIEKSVDLWGAGATHGRIMNAIGEQKHAWTTNWIQDDDVRRAIAVEANAEAVAINNAAIDENAPLEAGAWSGVVGVPEVEAGFDIGRAATVLDELDGATWVQQGNNLAFEFRRAGETFNVTIRLKPGTKIESNPDALIAYLLAREEVEHVIDPFSDEVPGRRSMAGTFFVGFDDSIQALERRGVNVPLATSIIATRVENAGRFFVGADQKALPTRVGQTRSEEEAAARERATTAITEKGKQAAYLAQVVRLQTGMDEAPMNQRLIDADLTLAGFLAEDPDLFDVSGDVDQLVTKILAENDETALLTEAFTKPALDLTVDVLQAWEGAIQYVGVMSMDAVGLDAVADLVDLVGEEGLGALLSGEALDLITAAPGLSPESAATITDTFRTLQEEGFPMALAAFEESVDELGKVAEFFGIDPESALAGWVNVGASIALDPITWLTVGGNAGFRGVMHSVTTVGGAEKFVMSRPMRSVAVQIVEKKNPNVLYILNSQGMSSGAISRLARIIGTDYADDAARLSGAAEVIDILRQELPAFGGVWLPAGPGRVLHRKSILGLGEYAARINRIGPKTPLGKLAQGKPARFMSDLMARAARSRHVYVNDQNFLGEWITLAAIRHSNNADDFSRAIIRGVDSYDAWRSGDDAAAILQGELEEARRILGASQSTTSNFRTTYKLMQRELKDLDDTIKRLGDDISPRGIDDVLPGLPDDELVFHVTSRAGADDIRNLGMDVGGLTANRDRVQSLITKLRSTGLKDSDDISVVIFRKSDLPDDVAALLERGDIERGFFGEFGDDLAQEAGLIGDETLRGPIPKGEVGLGALPEPLAVQPFADFSRRLAPQTDDVLAKLNAQRDILIPQLADNKATFDLTNTQIRGHRKSVADIGGRIESFSTSARSPLALEREMQLFMNDWAEELGLSKIKGAFNGRFPDIPLYDWSPITFDTGMSTFQSQMSNLSPFGEAFKEPLKQVGFLRNRGITALPASPYEIVAWRSTPNRDVIWPFLHQSAAGKKIKGALDTVQKVWTTSVLINVGTAVRSNLDEILRLYENSGANADLWKALTLRETTTSEGRAWVRRNLQHITAGRPARYSDWDLVNPGLTGNWVHAERWVNGTLLTDPQFKAYARAVFFNDSDEAIAAAWADWWRTDGYKISTKYTTAGTDVDAILSFKVIDDALGTWLGRKENLKGGLLEAAANNKKLPGGTSSAKNWRRYPQVPAEITEKSGLVDESFQFFYGSPQNRRGGVFYDHYYNFADTAYRNGDVKILDENWLRVNGYAATEAKAAEMIAAGSRDSTVRQLVRESGMILEEDIHIAAMRYASSNADDIMYTFGATSVLGKKTARIWPFGRAQVDYMQWWWTKLRQPSQFRPGVGGEIATGPLSQVNIRLVDRMAHLLNLREPGERADPLSPASVVDQFTFLPTAADSQLLIENIPTATLVPAWLLNAPFTPDVVRETIQLVQPGHAIFTDPAEDYADWLIQGWDTFFPKGRTTVWGAAVAARATALNLALTDPADLPQWLLASPLGVMYAAAGSAIGWNGDDPMTDVQERRFNSVMNGLLVGADGGPYVRSQFTLWAITDLDENGDSPINLSVGSQQFQDRLTGWDEAVMAGFRDTSGDWFKKIAGWPTQSGDDFEYVQPALGAEQYLTEWFDNGYLTDAQRDTLVTLMPVVRSGEATIEQMLGLVDALMPALFTGIPQEERVRFFAENKGANIFNVSWTEVIPRLVPSGTEGVVGNRVNLFGQDGRDLKALGRKDGWIKVREAPTEYASDAKFAYHRNVRLRTVDLYEEAVNGSDLWRKVINDEIDPETGTPFQLDIVWGDTGIKLLGGVGTGADPVTHIGRPITLQPEWLQENQWLLDRNGFKLPDEVMAKLTAGEEAKMPLGEFRNMYFELRERYAYKQTFDTVLQAMFINLGDDSTSPRLLAETISQIEGFEDVTVDDFVDLAAYGKDLIEDINKAVDKAERAFGWDDPREWDLDLMPLSWTEPDGTKKVVSIEDTINSETGEKVVGFRSLLRMAMVLSSIDNYDNMQITPDVYAGSYLQRWFGELGDPVPDPPPLSTFADEDRADIPFDRIDVIDGDTITFMGDDADVPFRIIGLASPESTQPGFTEARDALQRIFAEADQISIVTWKRDMFGRTQRFFNEQDGVIVHRDRLFAWVYVDGVVLMDPTLFTPTNVRGIQTGGAVPEEGFFAYYTGLLDARRQEKARR